LDKKISKTKSEIKLTVRGLPHLFCSVSNILIIRPDAREQHLVRAEGHPLVVLVVARRMKRLQLKGDAEKVPQVSQELGRDSPIVKHYSSIKNFCFVTCVNSAL
jgi:hypothetical protein